MNQLNFRPRLKPQTHTQTTRQTARPRLCPPLTLQPPAHQILPHPQLLPRQSRLRRRISSCSAAFPPASSTRPHHRQTRSRSRRAWQASSLVRRSRSPCWWVLGQVQVLWRDGRSGGTWRRQRVVSVPWEKAGRTGRGVGCTRLSFDLALICTPWTRQSCPPSPPNPVPLPVPPAPLPPVPLFEPARETPATVSRRAAMCATVPLLQRTKIESCQSYTARQHAAPSPPCPTSSPCVPYSPMLPVSEDVSLEPSAVQAVLGSPHLASSRASRPSADHVRASLPHPDPHTAPHLGILTA